MRKFLLLAAGFCLLLGGLSAMPVQKLPNDKTQFKACDLNFSFMLVDSKWRGGKFRNAVTQKLENGGVKNDYQVDFGKANGSFNCSLLPVKENKYNEVFNTDRLEYGGYGIANQGTLVSSTNGDGKNFLNITLPSLGCVIFERSRNSK